MYFWIGAAVYAIVWLLSPQVIQIALLGLTCLAGGIWYFLGGKRRRDKRVWYAVLTLALLVGAGRFLGGPIAQLKFSCLGGMYQDTANSYYAQLEDGADFQYLNDLRGPLFLTNGGRIEAYQEEGQLSLYFPVSDSFFNSYGYIYHPDGTLLLEKCDHAEELDANWAYVKLF